MMVASGCAVGSLSEPRRVAAHLRAVVEAIDAVDPGRHTADELDALVRLVRRAQSSIDGAIIRIGVRAAALAAECNGARPAEVLTGTGQVRAGTARREAARAELALRTPALQQALASGRLGPDHLDSLTRRLGPLPDDALANLDVDEVLADADRLPADTFDAALRRTTDALRDDGGAATAQSARAASEFRHWFDRRTGLGHLAATLDPERYEALTTAIDQHTTRLAAVAPAGSERSANLAADALVDLVCSSGKRGAHLPHVTVVVDQATLLGGRHPSTIAETADGLDLADPAIARLCCDAVLQRAVLDPDGVPIDVGRGTELPPPGNGLRSVPSTEAVPGPGATAPSATARPTISSPGNTADQPTSTTSCPSAPSTTTWSTKDDGTSNCSRIVRSESADPMEPITARPIHRRGDRRLSTTTAP